MTQQEIVRRRKQAARHRRRIIMDNDGNDAFHAPEATREAFLGCRTSGIVGTQIDTVVYSSWNAGFFRCSHDTRVGEVFTTKAQGFRKNKTRDFLRQGLDVLEMVVDFCRANGVEVFWSKRMNDMHDSWEAWYSPLIFPQLKKDHPEFLMGTRKNKPRCGGWAAVDYGYREIRDLAFAFIKDVYTRYDIDGGLLDFFRTPVFFRRHAMGGVVDKTELDQMTSLVRRVRKMADAVGRRRGRPILIAARVPDSVDFCKAIGLDVVRWMKEGLIDLLVVSGLFHLNPWEVSVRLGHRYGVPVYPCLSESRMTGQARRIRRSQACYRARAMNVWASGADGVFIFNKPDPGSRMYRQIGDPATPALLDKVYTTGARGIENVDVFLAGGERFLNRSPLSPQQPRPLAPGSTQRVELRVGESPGESRGAGARPDVRLRLRATGLGGPGDLTVRLNGTSVGKGAAARSWLEYAVRPSLVKIGINRVEIAMRRGGGERPVLKDMVLLVRYGKGR